MLTKKQKADTYAWLIDGGYWCYFDKCEFIPSLHKYRYCDADEGKVHYLSEKQLANSFDNIFSEDEQERLANEYLDDLEVFQHLGAH